MSSSSSCLKEKTLGAKSPKESIFRDILGDKAVVFWNWIGEKEIVQVRDVAVRAF